MTEFPPPRSPAEAALFKRIRAEIAALETGDWSLATDGDDAWLEAIEPDGARVELARFGDATTLDEQQLMARAPYAIGFLLALIDRAAGEIRELRAGQPKAQKPNPAAHCAIACGKPDFRAYLAEHHGLEADANGDTVAALVRKLLAVQSRADLNTDGEAAARWRDLFAKYRAWQTTGMAA